MSEPAGRGLGLPLSAIVSAGLVAAGVFSWLLLSRGLLIIAAFGAFGPGMLRELGWLRDHDEFQQQAAQRAGYHAYLVGGVAALIILSVIEWGGAPVDESAEWIRFLVVVLWLTWLSSMLLSYWGARKTAARVLSVFGAFWAVFIVATLIGDFGAVRAGASILPWLAGAAVGTGMIGTFFGLAWTARRWPRATGLVLLGVSLLFLFVFGRRPGQKLSTTAFTTALLIGPLVTCGLALAFDWGSEGGDTEPA